MIITSNQLPDEVRTNGAVAEVPRFPAMNAHGGMWITSGNVSQTLATYGNVCARKAIYCNMSGICGPSVKIPSVPTLSGSR